MKRLIVVSIAFGLIVGMAYAALIDPLHVTEAAPAQVTTVYQQTWISMAAEALAQDGDWERTRARLDTLRDPALPQTVEALFEQANAQGPRTTARALALLADRLNVRTAEMSVYLITPAVTPAVTPKVTNLPTPPANVRATPAPTATTAVTLTATPQPAIPSPAPTYNPSYQIISQIAECTRADSTRGNGASQIRVTVQDAAGQALPGVTVWITWDGGKDRFITGLKPEVNAGYGDFDMLRDRIYNVSIDQPESIVATGLQAEACNGGFISWRLIIRETTR